MNHLWPPTSSSSATGKPSTTSRRARCASLRRTTRRRQPCAAHTPAPRLGQILHEDNPNRKADNLCELTKLGQRQGREAGRRVRRLLGDDWEKVHWYPTESERDTAFAAMAERHGYYSSSDTPTQILEKISR